MCEMSVIRSLGAAKTVTQTSLLLTCVYFPVVEHRTQSKCRLLLVSTHMTEAYISVFSARDKSERAFGVAFVKLMNTDGTTLQDGRHDLVVYKVTLIEPGLRRAQYIPVPRECGFSGLFGIDMYKLQKSIQSCVYPLKSKGFQVTPYKSCTCCGRVSCMTIEYFRSISL